jgi:hypothetical protein
MGTPVFHITKSVNYLKIAQDVLHNIIKMYRLPTWPIYLNLCYLKKEFSSYFY